MCGATADIGICNECIELCNEIIAQQSDPGDSPPSGAA